MRKLIIWCETQTDLRVQRVRHDGGGEYTVGTLKAFYADRGIQMEVTAPNSPEGNGLAERFNLTMLDLALPMLADSGCPRHGLLPFGPERAGDAVLYAADLHKYHALVGRASRAHAARGLSGKCRPAGCVQAIRLSCVGAPAHVPTQAGASCPTWSIPGISAALGFGLVLRVA